MKDYLKSKGINYTAIAVIVFIIVLFFAMFSEEAKAEGYIGLGKSTFNAKAMTGEAGYRFGNNWDVGVQLIGSGMTSNGKQQETWIASGSHIIRPGWDIADYADFQMRLGVAYVDGSNLVGDWNFKLGIGFDFGPFEIEAIHYSSAGIWSPNTGIDVIMLRAKF